MKLFILTTLCFILGLQSTFAQNKTINLNDLWENYSYYPKYVPGFNFMLDGKHYSRLERAQNKVSINQYDLSTGSQTKIIYQNSQLPFSSYKFSAQEDKLLLATEVEAIYRHSTRANYYIYNRIDSSLIALSQQGKQRYASFSPSADKVAFVRNNNLFYKNLQTGQETQITNDGKYNHIINGATDWVYEEEFAIDKAFAWSPDGKMIAFLRFDESDVKEFTMMYYNNETYPSPYTFKYPKAGEKNAVVSAHIYHLDSKKIVKVDVGTEKDQYLPRLKWTPKNQLCVTRLNRHQNQLTLLLSNSKTGKTKTLLNEENKYFIPIHDDLTFISKKEFIWTSDQDGYSHIYLYNMKGKKVRQLTKGDFDVIQFYGYDEQRKKIFYLATAEGAENRTVYSQSIKGGKLEKISTQIGNNKASFSSTFDYFVNTHSSLGTPPSFEVRKTNENELVRTIEDNQVLKTKLETLELGKQELFTYMTKDSVLLKGWKIYPPNFDKNKQYPVLMYVYGGPGRQTVMNEWGGQNFLWFQMLAQQGYIVVSVDNRGTDARGEAFRKATYMELGKYETQDQIEVAHHLASEQYIDGNRIGIFGWSFGGYLSTLCLAKGADIFKLAIAVAPVINWKWYDSIYTERFMRSPQENKAGYEKNSPINFAHQIKGKYLLVHGLGDDNVHFQNAAEMARELVKHNIPFEQAFYTNKNHGIYGGATRLHLFSKMTSFLKTNL